MIKTFYNLFLHTNSWLIYKLITVKNLKLLGWSYFFKSYVMSNKSTSLKNRHILLICVIKNYCDKKKSQPILSHKFMIDL